MRANSTLRSQGPDRGLILAALLGKAFAIFAGSNSDDRKPLHKGNIGCDAGNTARREANNEQPTAERDTACAFSEGFPTDRIEYDVCAAGGDCLDLFAKACAVRPTSIYRLPSRLAHSPD